MEKTYKEIKEEELQFALDLKRERDEKIDEMKKQLKTLELTEDDLYRMLAGAMITEKEMAEEIELLGRMIDKMGFPLGLFEDMSKESTETSKRALRYLAENGNYTAQTIIDGIKAEITTRAKTAGKNGARNLHQPMGKLKQYAVGLYKQKKWISANEAAFELQQQIINHGKTINAHLKPSNAQRTIAEWFRKSV